MNPLDRKIRHEEFMHLREQVQTNPIVQSIVSAYACGEILTKDEAYSKMVMHFCEDYKERINREIDLYSKSYIPMIISLEPSL